MNTRKLNNLARVASRMGEHREAILNNWHTLCHADKTVAGNEGELSHIERAFHSLFDSLVRNIPKGDEIAYHQTAEVIAGEVAYNDIPYPKVVRAFHLFESSYADVIQQNFDHDEILPLLSDLDDLHHETIAILSQKYFELADDTILALVRLVELRDYETGGHLERTRDFAGALALHMGLPVDLRRNLHRVAPLHDIGKVGIPDSILLKPGKLSAEEFERMKTHTLLGEQVIREIMGSQIITRGHLITAQEIAKSHHERFDGSGYPDALAGDAIPLSARVFAVADVYDALISERPYKKSLSHEEAVQIIDSESRKHFDPAVVDAFASVNHAFPIIGRKHRSKAPAQDA